MNLFNFIKKTIPILLILTVPLCLFAAEPDDTYYSYLWGLERIDVERAWDISTGEGAVVAVV
ncbi:MAG: hypothetical protein ACE5JK_07500, partial [Candidatus Omnitrophota bacterium]